MELIKAMRATNSKAQCVWIGALLIALAMTTIQIEGLTGAKVVPVRPRPVVAKPGFVQKQIQIFNEKAAVARRAPIQIKPKAPIVARLRVPNPAARGTFTPGTRVVAPIKVKPVVTAPVKPIVPAKIKPLAPGLDAQKIQHLRKAEKAIEARQGLQMPTKVKAKNVKQEGKALRGIRRQTGDNPNTTSGEHQLTKQEQYAKIRELKKIRADLREHVKKRQAKNKKVGGA